jgi:hypothetical protein
MRYKIIKPLKKLIHALGLMPVRVLLALSAAGL